MICSRKEDCKTCTQEAYDKWNAYLKSGKVKKHNPWLTQNESIRDFVRWYELGWILISFTVLCLIWGWWGFLLAWILDKLNHGQGGPLADVFGEYPKEEPKIEYPKCPLGLKDCIHRPKII